MSKGEFVPYSRGKREQSEKPEDVEGEKDTGEGEDEDAEEDGEGAVRIRCCHVLWRDAYAPIRSTTIWSAIYSPVMQACFREEHPFR